MASPGANALPLGPPVLRRLQRAFQEDPAGTQGVAGRRRARQAGRARLWVCVCGGHEQVAKAAREEDETR